VSSFSLHGGGWGGGIFQKFLSGRLDWKEIFKAKLCTKTCYILYAPRQVSSVVWLVIISCK
jgi:hypothetical protein